MQRVSCLVLYTLGGGFEDWAFTEGTFTKEYFLHVTTEDFTDVHGYVRRPMLARTSLPLDARPSRRASHITPSPLPREQTSHINARKGRCTAILLDNAKIHHMHEFVARVAMHRARMLGREPREDSPCRVVPSLFHVGVRDLHPALLPLSVAA